MYYNYIKARFYADICTNDTYSILQVLANLIQTSVSFVESSQLEEENMTEMYKRIKELCEENHMTVSQMCKELSITRSCLSELSKGRTERLSAENSTKIANRFGVSVQYLISGREEDFDTKLKYALFNGTLGVTDEMFDEVKQYAEMVMLREEAKRRKAGEK